jgi:hypothetical protein
MNYNFGIMGVADLSHMGKMSTNRDSKIRMLEYGGRPWRFPNIQELSYIRSLKMEYNLGAFSEEYYWTSQSVLETSCVAYNMKKGNGLMIKNTSASASLILIKDI